MSKELKVGVFILSAVVIFLATLAYVDQLSGVRVPYKTYFKYAGGVDPGSPVRFGGMKVGAISAIRESKEDPTRIEVLLEVRGGVPVNADSVATLTSLSPLGDKYLEISTGTNKAARLPSGATIASAEPVSLEDLAQRASTLIPTVESVLQDVQKNINQLGPALANIQSITGPKNQQNIASLLADARQLLDKESPQIDRVLRNLESASSQADITLSKATDAIGMVQTAARTAGDSFANANRTIDDIRDPIKADLTELQRTLSDAQRAIGDLSSVVSANRSNIDDTVENLHAASVNLREMTASVRQRPWTLIRGKPAPDRAVPVVAGR